MTTTRRQKTLFTPELGLDILKRTAQGENNKQVAKELGLSYRTIERFLLKMREDYDAKNSAHLVYIATKKGLLV